MANALRAIALTSAVLVIVASCRQEITAPSEVRLDHVIVMKAEPPCIEIICLTDSTGAIVKCDTLDCN